MEQLVISDMSTSEVQIYNISDDSDINEEYIKNELGEFKFKFKEDEINKS